MLKNGQAGSDCKNADNKNNKRRDSPKTNYLPKTSMTGVRATGGVRTYSKKSEGVGRCDYGSYLGPRVDGRGGAGGRQGYHPVVPLVCGKGRRKGSDCPLSTLLTLRGGVMPGADRYGFGASPSGGGQLLNAPAGGSLLNALCGAAPTWSGLGLGLAQGQGHGKLMLGVRVRVRARAKGRGLGVGGLGVGGPRRGATPTPYPYPYPYPYP